MSETVETTLENLDTAISGEAAAVVGTAPAEKKLTSLAALMQPASVKMQSPVSGLSRAVARLPSMGMMKSAISLVQCSE